MSTEGGPNIERDGLVFGMDTGYGVANNSTATRFYRGEPTTNLKSSTQTNGSINGMQGVGVTYVGEEDGWKKFSLSGTFNAGTYPYCMYLSSQQCLAGQRYSTQVIIKTNVKDKFNYFGSNGVSYVNQPKNHEGVNSSTVLPDGSQLLQRQGFEYTSTTTQAGYLWTNPINGTTFNSSTDFVYLKDFQIEQNIHCTPFVSDEREETESLIDLTKTTDIDVSNISFDSTGQPTFDGTDDSIVLADPGVSSSTGFSVELVIKPGNASTSPMVIVPLSGGIDHWVRFNGNSTLYLRMIVAADSSVQDFVTSSTLSSSNYHHVIFTFKQSEGGKAFYNGNLENSASANFTALDWTSTWRVGQRGNNTYFYQGELPVLKVYDRALSADEVQQNYNAYKNRFNI